MSNYNPWGLYGQAPQMVPPRPMGPYGAPGAPRQLIRVSGLEGARAFQMAPNEVVALFDEGDDILYVKSTDGAGFPTVRRFRFQEEAEAAPAAPVAPEYVTRAEFEELKGMIVSGKQSVRKSQPQPVRVPADGPDAE